MVAYSDVPGINALYQEQEQVSQAIALIDAGGKVMSFTVSPPPPDPAVPSAMMMAAMISLADPPPELMAQARAALVIRQGEIITELETLGVTDSPAAMSARER